MIDFFKIKVGAMGLEPMLSSARGWQYKQANLRPRTKSKFRNIISLKENDYP